jgi:hypothetical protein
VSRAVREAVLVPWMLLTVALVGGLRITAGGELRFLVPPLASLVAMLLLVTVFARTGILRPWLLLGEHRSALENLNGAVVLLVLGAASAQIVSAVTPEAGLPLVLGVIFLFALFANTLAARPAKPQALRALFVAFFAAFTVKFIVLDALYAPDKSLGGRLLTGLLEGVTLGSLDHVVWGSATGYLVFLALVLYFAALVLMPGDEGTTRRVLPGSSRSSSSDLLRD